MMEVKIRAWLPLCGKMAYEMEKDQDLTDIWNNPDAEKDYILEPWTGKTDKNGNDIYVGDILTEGMFTAIVRFGDYADTWNAEAYHRGFYVEWEGEPAGMRRPELGYWCNKCVVTGNIHERDVK